jgi:hypothetical protein
MKKLYLLFPVLLLLFVSCSGSDSSNNEEAGMTELTLGKSVSGAISTVGEVDWYHYRANEANSILQVKCSSNTYRPDVDLLVTVYEEIGDNSKASNGNKVRLYADHAPEDSELPADIKMYLYLDAPKDLYFSVRDLMDDDASDSPYFLSVDLESKEGEGNDNFAQAIPLVVDDADSCQTDSIGHVGDVDCFRFEAQADGVYEIKVDFVPYQGGTDVRLCVDVYDSDGILVASLARGQGNEYCLLPCLTAGEYFVLIDENGRDDFDNASTYEICVNSIVADEVRENDTSDEATSIGFASPMVISGALEYWGDKDWYEFPLSGGAGFKVVNIAFTVEDMDFDYQINVEDAAHNLLLSHRHHGGPSVYQTQIKAGEGDHYLMIEPAEGETITESASYSVSIEVTDVDDADDIADIGNSPATAVELTTDTPPDPTNPTYIAYRGDEDWYKITVPPATPTEAQVLEVFLDTSGPSSVEYYLSMILGGNVVKKTFDTNGGDGATHLKMSVLVPESTQPLTYYFRVCDYQGDDGDSDVPYVIYANYRELIATKSDLPYDALRDLPDTKYYSEVGEIDETTSITLQQSSVQETEYKVNTSLFNFHGPNPPAWITMNADTPAAGQTTIEFPWIAGYVDYQGDKDFFQIDLSPLSGTDTAWYYDMKVEMHVGAPGSDVEYVWEFYRDSNQDQILVGRPSSASCIFASNGDTPATSPNPTALAPFDISDGFQGFWVGDGWASHSPLFYVSIGDFDYVNDPPDDDWGYDVPYYFRLTLVYHSGESQP